MFWLVMTVARVVPCTLCGRDIPIPYLLRDAGEIDRLVDQHLATHADEVERGLTQVLVPTCSRCRRVPLNGPTPHRPCFQPECSCSCSYPARKEG